jgi:16S rRNA (uracil1498-N3)-methyltransferase
MIGPEGDFTLAEINAAISHKFIPISLGDSRLRTETAGLEACFEINFLNR